MNSKIDVSARLRELIARQNRRLAGDALIKLLLGAIFSLVVFGFLYGFGWFVGFAIARNLGLAAWQFAVLFSGLFLVVASWSAWQRVDPLTGLRRLTDVEFALTVVGPAVGLHYFSPRHATAGAAVVLIGGPASVIEGFAIWASRLGAADSLIEQAAKLLIACKPSCPVEEIEHVDAAILLRRLAMIKVIPGSQSALVTVTEMGETALSGKGRGHKKRVGE